MYTSCWIGISIQMSTSWVDFTNKFLTSLYRSTLLRIYFRNLSVQRSFLQYKSQCMEKVNVKYVIKRLWYEIFHIVPGINPRPISALQLRCLAWYGSLWLIPRPIWKMSCNNLLLFHSETILHSIYSTWKLYYIINLFGCIFPLLEILLCNNKSSGGNFPYITFYPVPWKIPSGIGWNII
jgi:hypothetical protein